MEENKHLLSNWQIEIQNFLIESKTLYLAIFSMSGDLLFANPAMLSLFKSEPTKSFIQPKFDYFLECSDVNYPIYDGFITIGSELYGDTSILGKVYKKNDHLLFIGEMDVETLAKQYEIILTLNTDITNLQRRIIKEKHILQNEIAIRKKAEKHIKDLLSEKELILTEVHHRIKNNMNTVHSLLSLQSGHLENDEAKEVLLDAAGRLRSMMQLYDKLYRSEDTSVISIKDYLPDLIDEIVNVFPQKDSVKIENQIDDIVLGVDVISALGIIINELITNSMKYSFIGKSNNSISVSVQKMKDCITFIYKDNGLDIPETVTLENTTGFGMKLISILVQQINGTISLNRSDGTSFIIEFNV